MNTSLQSVITGLVDRIVREAAPLRIVLFGSATGNDDGPVNDIDLLIVMPEGTHRRHTAQNLYRKLDGIGYPFDLIVATPSDLERHKDTIGLVYRTALKDGEQLYAA